MRRFEVGRIRETPKVKRLIQPSLLLLLALALVCGVSMTRALAAPSIEDADEALEAVEDSEEALGAADEMGQETLAASKSEIQARMIDIIYGGAGGYVSCDFDGYVNTSGRHEGIDFALRSGAQIRSLIDGDVTYVSNASSLSTCAIYDATNDKTVVYLHGNYSVSSGQHVARGTVIGTEAANGAGSSAHTHVEVRNGWRQKAAKSVNDYTLENDNPYPY